MDFVIQMAEFPGDFHVQIWYEIIDGKLFIHKVDKWKPLDNYNEMC